MGKTVVDRKRRELQATIKSFPPIMTKYILSVVVLACVLDLAVTQGPRIACNRCHELEEEIGSKLKGHVTRIGITQLKQICPRLEQPNSTLHCEYITSLWEDMSSAKNKVRVLLLNFFRRFTLGWDMMLKKLTT